MPNKIYTEYKGKQKTMSGGILPVFSELGIGREGVAYNSSLLLLFATSGILLHSRPAFMFKPDGRFKAFGTKKDETILPFWVAISSAPIVYYAAAVA